MTSEEQTTRERSPEEIRADIQQARADLGETAAALAEQADVKKQAKHKVEDAKAQARAKVEGAKVQAKAKVEGSTVQRFASEHPVPLAIAGALLLGMAIRRRASR